MWRQKRHTNAVFSMKTSSWLTIVLNDDATSHRSRILTPLHGISDNPRHSEKLVTPESIFCDTVVSEKGLEPEISPTQPKQELTDRNNVRLPEGAFEKVATPTGFAYRCTVNGCSVKFTRKSVNAKAHYLEKHLGLKLHSCTVCKRDFSRASNLQRHLKTHRFSQGLLLYKSEMMGHE